MSRADLFNHKSVKDLGLGLMKNKSQQQTLRMKKEKEDNKKYDLVDQVYD